MRCIAPIGALAWAATCWGQTTVTIAAHPESPGIAMARDFIGLSFETGSLTSTTGFPAENPVLQRMVAQVGPGLLRFGGNSVDKLTGWMRGPRAPSTPASARRWGSWRANRPREPRSQAWPASSRPSPTPPAPRDL